MAEALRRVQETYESTKDQQSEHVPFLNIGQPTVYNLQNKDAFFLELLFEGRGVDGVLKHFLNDEWFKQMPKEDPNYVLRSYIAGSTNNVTPMHIDSFIPYLGPRPYIMQYAIILEKQTKENGAAVVVPRSHMSGEYATQEAFDDAISIESEVGDIVLWDSRPWHGTTANTTDSTRWSIIVTLCRCWMKQHWNIPMNLSQEIARPYAASEHVDHALYVQDATWGGYLDGTERLSPTSAHIVKHSDFTIGIGGGNIPRDELMADKKAGKEASLWRAEFHHQTAIDKARKKGRPPQPISPVPLRGLSS
jgi:hypothetical protein